MSILARRLELRTSALRAHPQPLVMVQLDTSPPLHDHVPASGPAVTGARRFLLFVEPVVRVPQPAAHVLDVPAGVSYLVPAAGSLQLLGAPPASVAGSLMLEPVRLGGRPRLLVATLGASPDRPSAGCTSPTVRLNGTPAPVVALLRVADQLRVGETLLHVSEYRDGRPWPAPQELVGSTCGLCRLPIEADSVVHVCDCGVALHLEGDAKPEGERLACGRLGDCPNCGSAVNTGCGPVWTPEPWS